MAAMRVASVAVALAILGGALPSALAVGPNVITEWLTVTQSTVISLAIDHQLAARTYSIVASAQYDSIKEARSNPRLRGKVPEEAAVAYASHSALSHLYVWRQSTVYDAVLYRHLAQFNVTDALVPALKQAIVPLVQRIASKRLVDGSAAFSNYKFLDNSTDNWGRYQPSPGQTSVRYPQVASSLGIYLSRLDVERFTDQFRRFQLGDPEYARQLEAVKLYGSLNSTLRSPYENNSPRFWALNAGTGTIAGLWINTTISLIPDDTPLIHQARLLKLLTTSFWDAAIACWHTKFREQFWRPITAIRTQHGVGVADPSWTPFLPTPAHPEYPSGHQCSSGAAWGVLERYFGADYTFNVTNQVALDISPRTFTSFAAAAADSGDSRFFAGVHFQKANRDGALLGYNIARYIHDTVYGGITFSDPL